MNSEHDMNNTSAPRNIASSVLSRIDKEGITPTPRWHFLLRESSVWTLGGLAVLFGSFAVAAIIFVALDSDWEFYEATHDNLLTFAVAVMPYTWLIALLVFGVLAYESVRHTKRGYRYSLPVMVLGSVGASVVCGSTLYALGVGPYIDSEIGSRIPMHQSLAQTKLGFWNQPERGIMAGLVTEVATSGETFVLETPDHVTHVIHAQDLDEEIRSTIVVGSAIRVLAPMMREMPPEPEVAREGSDMFATQMADTAPENGDVAPFAAAKAKSAVVRELREDVRQARHELIEMREACLVMPFDFASRENNRGKGSIKNEVREKCFKELRERRGHEKENESEEED